ncbi:MAG: dihydroorotate dehydrogenase-like protein [Acidimicrobiia bacterium]
MTDLRTSYLGLDLAAPVVASAGPLTGHLDSLHALVQAGAAAVVLPSLFEEDVVRSLQEYERIAAAGTHSFAEALSYLPDIELDPTGLDRHVALVETAARELDVPVIASLNGVSIGGWTEYARVLTDAGADALELNVYAVAADGHDTAAAVEDRTVELVHAVRDVTTKPLAVKLSPFYTATAHVARRIVDAGADGLVLFNRFFQPDIDLETLTVRPSTTLSTPAELPLRLRWIALVHGRIHASLAVSGGVHDATDVVKVLLAGGDVAMTTSALLRHGPAHVRTLLDGLTAWLDGREYESVAQLRGSMSAQAVPDPDAYERAAYVETIHHFADRRSPGAWS